MNRPIFLLAEAAGLNEEAFRMMVGNLQTDLWAMDTSGTQEQRVEAQKRLEAWAPHAARLVLHFLGLTPSPVPEEIEG
ncbi:hypothetical protein [Deinococcus sp. QL22]|uniref:hypothetical protein n=1 Tax=Deinococcus sp. QL22 TaxID=2939437 RepID=UPI002016B713|nr:hypothetical protein [Deinococcus sp. QL22]UQN09297.1 hypothetical protein M1R55_22240 [Deinococcus sp. QL22]